MRSLFQTLKGVESAPLPIAVNTPDVTRAQVGGWLQFAASVGIGVGLLQPAEAEVLIGASALVAASLHIADAVIRKGRAGMVASLHMSAPGMVKQIADISGPGHAGVNAPPAEPTEVPDSPTLQGAPTVDTSLDGTGTTPPQDAQEALNADKVAAQPDPPVTAAPAPAEATGPPPPTLEEIAAAQQAADDAAGQLAALKARRQTTQQ